MILSLAPLSRLRSLSRGQIAVWIGIERDLPDLTWLKAAKLSGLCCRRYRPCLRLTTPSLAADEAVMAAQCAYSAPVTYCGSAHSVRACECENTIV